MEVRGFCGTQFRLIFVVMIFLQMQTEACVAPKGRVIDDGDKGRWIKRPWYILRCCPGIFLHLRMWTKLWLVALDVPYLRRPNTGFCSLDLGFDPGFLHVRFVLEEMTFWQSFLRASSVFPSSSSFHHYSALICDRTVVLTMHQFVTLSVFQLAASYLTQHSASCKVRTLRLFYEFGSRFESRTPQYKAGLRTT